MVSPETSLKWVKQNRVSADAPSEALARNILRDY
jgi:hypothetical protein